MSRRQTLLFNFERVAVDYRTEERAYTESIQWVCFSPEFNPSIFIEKLRPNQKYKSIFITQTLFNAIIRELKPSC
jgi:hypothetical protein